jgi:hypothetical protein
MYDDACILFRGFLNLECNVNSSYSARIAVLLILQLLYEQEMIGVTEQGGSK